MPENTASFKVMARLPASEGTDKAEAKTRKTAKRRAKRTRAATEEQTSKPIDPFTRRQAAINQLIRDINSHGPEKLKVFKNAAMQTIRGAYYTRSARRGRPQTTMDLNLVSSLVCRILHTMQKCMAGEEKEHLNSVLELLFEALWMGMAVRTAGSVQLLVEEGLTKIRQAVLLANQSTAMETVFAALYSDFMTLDCCWLVLTTEGWDCENIKPVASRGSHTKELLADDKFVAHAIKNQKGICPVKGCGKSLTLATKPGDKPFLSIRRVGGEGPINLGNGIPAFDTSPALCSIACYLYSEGITNVVLSHLEVVHAEGCTPQAN